MDLFELDSLEDEPAFLAAARRANRDENLNVLQCAWCACVRKQALLKPPTEPYSPKELKRLARSLSKTLHTSQDFEGLPDRFRKAGLRLVFVDAFPSAKIDGGAMYADSYPVIGLSGRGKRLDKVLFTLLHEIAHILRRHVDADHYIVEEIDDHTTAMPVRVGRPQPAREARLATRYLAGLIGSRMPAPMGAFAAGCTLASPRRRPRDAWQLLAEYDDLLERLYGPRTFRPFAMPA